ncbi:hypothetical protein [Micromonospora sp. R77]|nr:hypothetical protein [Micromonospora sp. R77]
MTNVWQIPDGIHQHVLVASGTPNDLDQLYGLSQPSTTPTAER